MSLESRLFAFVTAVGTDMKAALLRLLPAGGTAGQVLAKTSGADYAAGWITPSAGGGGSALGGVVTVTVPNSRWEHVQTVAAPGLTSSSRVVLGLAPTAVTDENDPELLDVRSLSGKPGEGTLTVTLTFASRTSGPILLTYLAV